MHSRMPAPCIWQKGYPGPHYWTWHVAAGRDPGRAASEGKARLCGEKQRDECPHMPRFGWSEEAEDERDGELFAKAARKQSPACLGEALFIKARMACLS